MMGVVVLMLKKCGLFGKLFGCVGRVLYCIVIIVNWLGFDSSRYIMKGLN